ncbi:MAG: RagB/SusD family nutrient uptake outer membrane protein [Odoribacter sp.]
MKIKIVSKVILAVTLLTSVGCNDWLDVTPQAQINADKLFSTPAGFESSLYGIYTSMTRSSMYGQQMTFGFMDVLAQYYKVYSSSNHHFYEAAQYNYENGKSKDAIRGIWLDSYNTIANCNILLEYLDKKTPEFFEKNYYSIIKGEALAIRAYLHFDMLRAFAPSWKDNQTGMSVPYADSFTKKIHKQLSTEEVVKRVLADLDMARGLLKDIDPVFLNQFKEMMYHYGQPFGNVPNLLDFRAYRMNYFAVTGLMARVYNYMGDKQAYIYAKEVIDAADEGCFQFATEGEVSEEAKSKDVVMKNEILFALNFSGVHQLFYQSDASSRSGYDLNDVASLFPFPDDLRKHLVGKEYGSRKTEVSCKFADIKSENGGKVPMIRLSEMYLIAAERHYEENHGEAVKYLEKLQEKRGITQDLTGISFDKLLKELTQEARREFVSEGQMFYWYKRLGLPVNRGTGSVILTKQNFSLPLPSAEIEFGGRVEEYLK